MRFCFLFIRTDRSLPHIWRKSMTFALCTLHIYRWRSYISFFKNELSHRTGWFQVGCLLKDAENMEQIMVDYRISSTPSKRCSQYQSWTLRNNMEWVVAILCKVLFQLQDGKIGKKTRFDSVSISLFRYLMAHVNPHLYMGFTVKFVWQHIPARRVDRIWSPGLPDHFRSHDLSLGTTRSPDLVPEPRSIKLGQSTVQDMCYLWSVDAKMPKHDRTPLNEDCIFKD